MIVVLLTRLRRSFSCPLLAMRLAIGGRVPDMFNSRAIISTFMKEICKMYTVRKIVLIIILVVFSTLVPDTVQDADAVLCTHRMVSCNRSCIYGWRDKYSQIVFRPACRYTYDETVQLLPIGGSCGVIWTYNWQPIGCWIMVGPNPWPNSSAVCYNPLTDE